MNNAFTLLSQRPAGDASAWVGAGLRHWFNRTGQGLWRALEVAGRARAHRHLLDFADQCEAQQPELAKELRAATREGMSR